MLFERDPELTAMTQALDEAFDGRGSVVLVYGEAGIGKTSLVESFLEFANDRARIVTAACDDLLTPRALGPFRDLARKIGGPLAEATDQGSDRDAIFSAALDELSQPTTVLVIEDAHWADDATLDVLRYLGRRIGELHGLLVLTYRSDDITEAHPLQRVLGALTSQDVQRLPLQPLSRGAIERMCSASGRDVDKILRATGGNPFFVNEALVSRTEGVPATIRDAVLARIGGLDDSTRRSLQLLSVVPGHAETRLVKKLIGDDLWSLDEAEQRGLIVAETEGFRFRHDLVRKVVSQALPSASRIDYNRRALEALKALDDVEVSRIVHYAKEAQDSEAMVEYGLAAARQSVTAGANHEALAHYERVLALPSLLSEQDYVDVMEESVWVLYNLYRFHEAAARAHDLVRLRERMGEPTALARGLIALSRTLYMVNDPIGSEKAVMTAVDLLEPLGDNSDLARAYSYLAAILKLSDRPEEAITRAHQALDMAERESRTDVVAHSLNYLGCALMDLGDIDGADHLRRSAQMAHSIHHHEYAQRAYTNLVEGLYRMGRYDELDEPIERGLAHARDYAFPSHEYNIEAHRCMLLTLRGKYAEAERGLRQLMDVEDPGVLATFSLSALGRLLARRGSPEAAALLEAAWDTATTTDSVQSIAHAGIALVESAWLRGDLEAAIEHAELPLERTKTKGAERYHGELLRFLARCNVPTVPFELCPEEFALGLAGDFDGAARAWRKIGAPYEEALELADSGDESKMLEGLAKLDDLGTTAAADVVRRRLKAMGIRRVPGPPRPGARTHPAGLTNRQLEVLSLLANGSTNAEIAETLVVSTRTVDHHVSAILQKLNVETRRQASREAVRLGISAGRPIA